MMSYFKYYFDTSDLKLSLGAEKLLNIFRDRYELSAKTGFTGKNGNVVFLIKMTEIAELLGKTERTAQRVLNELREKGLVFTQKRQSGILEFSLINNFPHDKNVSFQTDKNVSFQTDKNGKMIHISQTKQARLTKPNARMRTHEASQSELSQTQPSEATSRHSFSRAELGEQIWQSELRKHSEPSQQSQQKTQSTPNEQITQSELGNSRIPSGAQDKTQTQTQTQEKTQAQTQTQDKSQAPSQAQTQDKTQAPSTARQWLGINDKPSYISEQTWQDFCAYKRERRHNFTATGKKAFFAKLDDIEAKSGACETAIKNTMANGWQGVFMPPLDKAQGKSQGQVMKPAQMVDALQEWLSDRQAQVIESVESIQSEQELPQALPSRERRA